MKYKHAVILAGGKGTRLMPLTENLPKPMVAVGGEPFLHWQLRYLQTQGVEDVLLLVSHLASVIQDHFAKHPIPGLNLRYSIEPTPMGTGGALAYAHAKAQLPHKFWLLNGDSFLYTDLKKMAQFTDDGGFEVSMATATATKIETSTTGEIAAIANLRTDGDVVVDYKKDGAAGFTHTDAGVYLLSRGVVEAGQGGSFDLGALWPPVIKRRALGGYAVSERFFDIGTPERLEIFAQHLPKFFKI